MHHGSGPDGSTEYKSATRYRVQGELASEVVSMSPTTKKSSPDPQACRGARDRQGLRRFAMACGHPCPSLRPRGQLPPCRDEEMSVAVEQGDDPHGLITTTLDAPHTSIPEWCEAQVSNKHRPHPEELAFCARLEGWPHPSWIETRKMRSSP